MRDGNDRYNVTFQFCLIVGATPSFDLAQDGELVEPCGCPIGIGQALNGSGAGQARGPAPTIFLQYAYRDKFPVLRGAYI
jgi:hypothetical protein